jgi:hypothetical protein
MTTLVLTTKTATKKSGLLKAEAKIAKSEEGLRLRFAHDCSKMSWKTDITEEERVVVDKLKVRMKADGVTIKKDILDHDVHIARFVRARKFDEDKAFEMLKDNQQWREENDGERRGLSFLFFGTSFSL